jgi:hypothetical protein
MLGSRTEFIMTDQEFARQLEQCTLPAAQFDHAGHVRLAWIYLREMEFDDAITATCETIERYATHLGAHAKFHHTVTNALITLLDAGGAADLTLDWNAFRHRNNALLSDARAALEQHYSPALLASDAARRCFVAPDRLPLPCVR